MCPPDDVSFITRWRSKTWLDELNEGTIKTWDELRTAFISRFFPPALFDQHFEEILAFSQYENESLTDSWLRMKEMLRNCHGHNLSKGNIIKIFYHGLNEITQEDLNAAVGKTNSDIDKIMARMDAITVQRDAQYKEFQSRSKQPNLDDDDIPMSREKEAKFNPNIPSLAERSFQYPVGIAKNMLVEVGKFTFPADFVILAMEEDNKVPLILGRPFLHNADAVIRVKQKQLNLGVRTERMTFHIDSSMKHSYSIDDTCFSINFIDEILEEDFDALLDEGSKILHSIEGTILKEKL
ncbi:reverse transcriptase domain-containing protein [Tanacetum coccineum]